MPACEEESIKVSIVLPVYNVEPYIGECLQSVIAQTYTNIECLLVDDCGSDGSMSIAERIVAEYDGPIVFRLLHHDSNSGLSAARNSGIHSATGDYVYFLDSDDKLFPTSIEALVRLAVKYPNADVVQGNYEMQKVERVDIHFSDELLPEFIADSKDVCRLMLKGRFPITATNKLVRRQFISDNSLYFMEGIIHEDEIWKWAMSKQVSSVAVCFENTYWYRRENTSSIMNVKDRTRSFESLIMIAEQIAMRTETMYDVRFVELLIMPSKKINRWADVHQKPKVMATLDASIARLKANRGNKYIIRQLELLRLPVWFLKTRLFGKLYSEYAKHIGLYDDKLLFSTAV